MTNKKKEKTTRGLERWLSHSRIGLQPKIQEKTKSLVITATKHGSTRFPVTYWEGSWNTCPLFDDVTTLASPHHCRSSVLVSKLRFLGWVESPDW